MAEYEIQVNEALLSNLLGGGKEGLGELAESLERMFLSETAAEAREKAHALMEEME